MCNVWNTGAYTRNGCCGGFTTVNTINTANTTNRTGNVDGFCGYWNGTWQRMCRDACGNILTRNGGYCGCQHYCHPCCQPRPCCPCGCNVGNGTTGNNGVTGNNGGTTGGNGGFRCITFCGFGNGLTQTTGTPTRTNTDAYYARQYGLTCDDNADCVYNF